MNTPQFAALSGRAIKLLIELELQYTGTNNGDLCATYGLMSKRGFKSGDQLAKARDELINTGWIMVARQGGRHIPTLYAVTYRAIDRCDGKLDIAADPMPPHLWKPDNAKWREIRSPSPIPARGFRGSGKRKPRKGSGAKVVRLNRDTVQLEPPHGAMLNRHTEQAS